MKTVSKIVILGLVLWGFFFLSSLDASGKKGEIDYAENHLSALIIRGKLGEVLLAVAEKTEVEFLFNEEIAKKEVSFSFERLPLHEGVKKILHQFSYSMVFGPKGQLKKVIVCEKGLTSPDGPGSARYSSSQRSSNGPKGISPPGSIDSSVGPAGPDESLPMSAPIEGSQGNIQQLNHDDIDLSPAPTNDDKLADSAVPNQPAGEMTTSPVEKETIDPEREP